MPTRFYLSSVEAAAVSPVVGAWGSVAFRFDDMLLWAKNADEVLTTGARVGWTAGQTALNGVFVSDPLAAGISFTGATVRLQLACREFNNGDNSTSRLRVAIVSQDGQTVRQVLLALGQWGPATEFVNNATLRNKAYADGDAVAGSYTTVLGDRIVVEIGYADTGSTPEAQARYGAPSATADHGQNETETTALVPWVEFSNVITAAPTEIAPGGAGSAEATGSARLDMEAAPGGASTAEQVGGARVDMEVSGVGAVASSEAVGTAAVSNEGPAAQDVLPGGVPSAEAVGTSRLDEQVDGAGVGSLEAVGTPALDLQIAVPGVASQEAVGGLAVEPTVSVAGAASAEAVPGPLVAPDQDIAPGGLASLEAAGTPSVSLSVAPQGVPSAEAVGTPALQAPQDVGVPGAGSQEAVGTAQVMPSLGLPGVPSGEGVGTPGLFFVLVAGGVGSTEAVGVPALSNAYEIVAVFGVASAEQVGAPSLEVVGGAQIVAPTGVPSAEQVGWSYCGAPTSTRGARGGGRNRSRMAEVKTQATEFHDLICGPYHRRSPSR